MTVDGDLLFSAAKFLTLFVYPLGLSLTLSILGLLLLWRGALRSGRALLTLTFAWLYLCSTGMFSAFLIGQLEDRYPARALSGVPRSGAIILLSGATRGYPHMGTLSDLNQHADRLVHALALYKAGKAPVVLVSGGVIRGEHAESEQLRDLLMLMGVPEGDMLLETESRNTYENAVYSAAIVRERGWQQVLLVTSSFHMPRAVAVFRKQGIEVIPAPTDFMRIVAEGFLPGSGLVPGAKNLLLSSLAIHEMLGYQMYRLRGWI